MSARLALALLALFALADSFVLTGSSAVAQVVINHNPPAPATHNGNAYYNPGANNNVTITDQSSTSNGVTTSTRNIQNTTPLPQPFTPNSYSAAGFTPTPQGYANAGQQSAITANSAGRSGNAYAPNAQFAPSAAGSANPYSPASTAQYNGAAEAGINAASGSVGAANIDANAVNATRSHASYNGD